MAPKPSPYATQDQVAEHLDISVQRLRTIMNKGNLPRWNKEPPNLDTYRVAYIRWIRGIATGHKSQDSNLDLSAERAKLTRAQTEKTQIEISRLTGDRLA